MRTIAKKPLARRGRPKKTHLLKQLQIRVPMHLHEAIVAVRKRKHLMSNASGARELMRTGAEVLGLVEPRK